MTLEQTLRDKEKYTCLSGTNIRLFRQDTMDGAFVVTDQNKHIVSAGWQVITWKGSKPITLYFGDSLEDALETFNKNNS
jgi:hypothetical protein